MEKLSIEERRKILKKNRLKQLLIFIGLAFGLALIVGIILDIRTLENKKDLIPLNYSSDIQTLILGLTEKPYMDEDRLFSLIPPSGWRVEENPEGTGYNVTFRSPNGPEISIMATKVDYNDFQQLKRKIKNIEKQYGMNTHMEESGFIGREAIRRTAGLQLSKVITYDFIESNVAHHIQVAMPHELAAKYEPILMDIIETYEPSPTD